MQNPVAVLSLALAVGALGVAGYTHLQERADPIDLEARLDAIDERVARMERDIQRGTAQRAPPGGDTPELAATDRGEPPAPDLLTVDAPAPDPAAPGTPPGGAGLMGLDPTAREDAAKEIASLVEEAVEKKAAQMLVMRNKKPAIDAFAKTLALTDLQRKAAEEEILRAQNEIYATLDVRAGDGTNFLDEVVDIVADNIANPGKRPGRFGKLFARLMSEKVPGTDQSYAERVEASKQRVRESFKRNWSAKQYASFEEWQMDPTEIKGIEGSPQKELERRIIERARALGAEIPENAGK